MFALFVRLRFANHTYLTYVLYCAVSVIGVVGTNSVAYSSEMLFEIFEKKASNSRELRLLNVVLNRSTLQGLYKFRVNN